MEFSGHLHSTPTLLPGKQLPGETEWAVELVWMLFLPVPRNEIQYLCCQAFDLVSMQTKPFQLPFGQTSVSKTSLTFFMKHSKETLAIKAISAPHF
jgi:hypothetical protein